MTKWQWFTFLELTTTDLYNVLALRQEVFVLEQKSLYPDLDYLDQAALHLLGKSNGKLHGYCRIFLQNSLYPDATSIGRVVVAPHSRKQQLGKALMQEALRYLDEHSSHLPTIIGAQLYLKNFYASFGFIAKGNEYDEDGVPHIKMIRIPAATTLDHST